MSIQKKKAPKKLAAKRPRAQRGRGRERNNVKTTRASRALEKYMKASDLGPAGLAKKARVSIPTVYNILTGRRPNPSFNTLSKIDRALGLDGKLLAECGAA